MADARENNIPCSLFKTGMQQTSRGIPVWKLKKINHCASL